MGIRRTTQILGLIGLAGVAVATALLLQGFQSSRTNGKPEADPQARALINAMDTVIQQRFGTSDLYRGMSRAVMAGSDKELHHPNPIYATNPPEKKLLDEVQAMQRPYEVCFFHYKPIPRSLKPFSVGTSHGFPPTARYSPDPALICLTAQMPAFDSGRHSIRLTPEEQAQRRAEFKKWEDGVKAHENALKAIAVKETSRLNRGERVETLYQDWYVEMRPLVASADSCLKCHTNARKGETLAAMVYLVRKAESTHAVQNP